MVSAGGLSGFQQIRKGGQVMRYERPRLVDIEIDKTEGGGCENGSVNVEECENGGTVVPSCKVGGIPTAEIS